MTRDAIIKQLKEMRAKGYTYKLIAQEAKLDNPDQLYKFINRDAPAAWVKQQLENYLRRVNGNGSNE